jgi:hypothetical protein
LDRKTNKTSKVPLIQIGGGGGNRIIDVNIGYIVIFSFQKLLGAPTIAPGPLTLISATEPRRV